MVPPVTVDAARSLKTLPLQARIDEDIEVLGVVVSRDMLYGRGSESFGNVFVALVGVKAVD